MEEALGRAFVPHKLSLRHKLSHHPGNIQGVCVVSGVYVVGFGGVAWVGLGQVQHQRQQWQTATERDSLGGFEIGCAVSGASDESLMPEHFELFNHCVAGPAKVFGKAGYARRCVVVGSAESSHHVKRRGLGVVEPWSEASRLASSVGQRVGDALDLDLGQPAEALSVGDGASGCA